MKERLTQLRAFLNPLNRAGSVVGRIAAPLIVAAAIASQTVPGTPFNLAGLTEIGGGVTQPGAELIFGLDLSYDEPSLQWWQERRADGVRVAMQGVIVEPVTGQETPAGACTNLYNMEVAGILPTEYIVISRWVPAAASVDAGYAACPGIWPRLGFVAIDVERPLDNPAADITAAINRVRELGQLPVIYSSWWMWLQYVGSWTPDVPLINAYWDEDADVDYLKLPYGFTVLVGEQYTGGGDWDGINVDRAVFHAGLVYQPPLPPTPAITPSPALPSPPPVISASSGPLLIKLATDPEVFVVVGEVNRYRLSLCSPEMFVGEGYRWEDIRVVTEDSPLWKLPSWRCN